MRPILQEGAPVLNNIPNAIGALTYVPSHQIQQQSYLPPMLQAIPQSIVPLHPNQIRNDTIMTSNAPPPPQPLSSQMLVLGVYPFGVLGLQQPVHHVPPKILGIESSTGYGAIVPPNGGAPPPLRNNVSPNYPL